MFVFAGSRAGRRRGLKNVYWPNVYPIAHYALIAMDASGFLFPISVAYNPTTGRLVLGPGQTINPVETDGSQVLGDLTHPFTIYSFSTISGTNWSVTTQKNTEGAPSNKLYLAGGMVQYSGFDNAETVKLGRFDGATGSTALVWQSDAIEIHLRAASGSAWQEYVWPLNPPAVDGAILTSNTATPGQWSWASTLPIANGGTGADLSGSAQSLVKVNDAGTAIEATGLFEDSGVLWLPEDMQVATTNVATNMTRIKFMERPMNGTNYVSLEGPPAVHSDLNWILPQDYPTGSSGEQFMTASGGTMSFENVSGAAFIPQVANTFFAGPISGADAKPTFRILVSADIPADYRSRIVGRTQGALAGVSGLTEVVIGSISSTAYTVTRCEYLTSGALTANDTNYATLTVYGYNADGSNKVTIGSKTTKITGGSGNWTAMTSIPLTLTNTARQAASILTIEVVKSGGSGVTLPAGQWQITGSIG